MERIEGVPSPEPPDTTAFDCEETLGLDPKTMTEDDAGGKLLFPVVFITWIEGADDEVIVVTPFVQIPLRSSFCCCCNFCWKWFVKKGPAVDPALKLEEREWGEVRADFKIHMDDEGGIDDDDVVAARMMLMELEVREFEVIVVTPFVQIPFSCLCCKDCWKGPVEVLNWEETEKGDVRADLRIHMEEGTETVAWEEDVGTETVRKVIAKGLLDAEEEEGGNSNKFLLRGEEVMGVDDDVTGKDMVVTEEPFVRPLTPKELLPLITWLQPSPGLRLLFFLCFLYLTL